MEVLFLAGRGYNFILKYNPDDSYILMRLIGFMEGEVFRENTVRMLDFIKEHKVNKVLVDARKMDSIRHSDSHWLKNVFLPNAISEGFEVVSFIKPSDYYAKLSIENVMYRISETLKGAWFEDPYAARKWLVQA